MGAGFAIAPSVAGQSGDLVDSANGGLQQLQDYVQRTRFVSAAQIDDGLQRLQEQITGSASSIASGVLTGVSAVTNGLITLIITLILTFLFLLLLIAAIVVAVVLIMGQSGGPTTRDFSGGVRQTLQDLRDAIDDNTK